jgi:hypothetical protein
MEDLYNIVKSTPIDVKNPEEPTPKKKFWSLERFKNLFSVDNF